jgi:hypothetical protein
MPTEQPPKSTGYVVMIYAKPDAWKFWFTAANRAASRVIVL